MKKVLSATIAVAALAGAANAQLFISEVVDGDLAGGNPKFVEICNATGSPVTFGPNDFVHVYFNGSSTLNGFGTVSLDGITILANDALVIASNQNSGDLAFFAAYGFNADLYTSASFGNGDDVYALELGGTNVDTFGTIGVDGTGTAWEYLDSYAFRNVVATPNGGAFNVGGDLGTWTFGGVAALDGADDPTRIALLQQRTTPGTHPVPTPGALALLGLGGLAAARRRRA